MQKRDTVFVYPGACAFTPVCTTEIMTFASMQDLFAAKNAALLGLSVDSNPSHIDWVRAMGNYSWNGINRPQVAFPIIADDFGNIARMYGMLMPSASATKTVRNVYVIDPEGIVRAILIYPLTTGRNTEEIYRLLLALQAYDQTGYATPANWQPGQSQIYPVPQTVPMSSQRLDEQKSGGYSCVDWYLCLTRPDNNASAAPMGSANMQQQMPEMKMPMQSAAPVQTPNVPAPKMMEPMQAENIMPGVNAQAVMPDNIFFDVIQPGRPFAPELAAQVNQPTPFNPAIVQMPQIPGNSQAPNNMTGMQMPKKASGGTSNKSIMDENRNMFGSKYRF